MTPCRRDAIIISLPRRRAIDACCRQPIMLLLAPFCRAFRYYTIYCRHYYVDDMLFTQRYKNIDAMIFWRRCLILMLHTPCRRVIVFADTVRLARQR